MTGLLSPWLERKRVRRALAYVDDDLEVLDVGCGRAPLLAHLTPARYVGIDILDAVIQSNRARFPQHEFFVRDVSEASPEGVGVFDVVVMLAVLEHFEDPAKALRHLRETLREHGRIVLTTPHPSGEKILDWGALFGVCSPEAEDEHAPLMDEARLREVAAQAGLVVLQYERFLAGLNQLAVLGLTPDPLVDLDP